MPASAMAQSAVDGTWKVDMSKAQLPNKPDVYLLQAGMFDCKTCVPPVEVKADGQDQKVTGHPYYDSMIVKIVNDYSIEQTVKLQGKIVATSKWTVSPDGNTLIVEFSNSSDTNAAPVSGNGEATRVAKGPANSHGNFRLLARVKTGEPIGQRCPWRIVISPCHMACNIVTSFSLCYSFKRALSFGEAQAIDARQAYEHALQVVAAVLGQSYEGGDVNLRPDLLKYLVERNAAEPQPEKQR
jgi:hypothetical protein